MRLNNERRGKKEKKKITFPKNMKDATRLRVLKILFQQKFCNTYPLEFGIEIEILRRAEEKISSPLTERDVLGHKLRQ